MLPDSHKKVEVKIAPTQERERGRFEHHEEGKRNKGEVAEGTEECGGGTIWFLAWDEKNGEEDEEKKRETRRNRIKSRQEGESSVESTIKQRLGG